MTVLLPTNDSNGSGNSEDTIFTDQNRTGAEDEYDHSAMAMLLGNITFSFILIISLLGLWGNGVVIKILGFRIKRTPYTIYILNLSGADFGVLICLICLTIGKFVDTLDERHSVLPWFVNIIVQLFFFTYSTSQFLLAAISIDRCVAVLFPLWHRYHRPPHLSPIACALIWILSFLLPGINITLLVTGILLVPPLLFQVIVNVLLSAPLMVISTLTLFINVNCKAKRAHRGKLVTAILLALLFFLLFAFPLNVFYIIRWPFFNLIPIGLVCASLNSSINPLIYFLVGKRQRKSPARVSIKVALQRVFEDEQECEEESTRCETSV
ncbi:hypothetical protein JRQ81_010814 [Phrynocephalus forsythii]|uniref:G-protein coupled receptors family 1 profile domain-containing protein n=1 Tax=Phrynocephalus forsythii TaxID=171643 RepID=A0A9Q0Y0E3_9SAUR|nr:hypothetical protein JRQ81_010814 [Phrynocephalus forsythii]